MYDASNFLYQFKTAGRKALQSLLNETYERGEE